MSVMMKRKVVSRLPSFRCYSSHTTPLWDLFPPTKVPVKSEETPPFVMNMKDNLEFALERMRIIEGPVALQMIYDNACRPKKVNHGKRPCSHPRRRLKRHGRRFNK